MSVEYKLSGLKGIELKNQAKQRYKQFGVEAPLEFPSFDDVNEPNYASISKLEKLYGNIHILISSYPSLALLKQTDRTADDDDVGGRKKVDIYFDHKRKIYGVWNENHSGEVAGIDCEKCGTHFQKKSNLNRHRQGGQCERLLEQRRRIEHPSMADPFHPREYRPREDIAERIESLGVELTKKQKRNLICEMFTSWDTESSLVNLRGDGHFHEPEEIPATFEGLKSGSRAINYVQEHESLAVCCTDIFDLDKTYEYIRDPRDTDPAHFLKQFARKLLELAEQQARVMQKRLKSVFELLDVMEKSFQHDQCKPSLAKRVASIRRILLRHTEQLVVVGFNSSRYRISQDLDYSNI